MARAERYGGTLYQRRRAATAASRRVSAALVALAATLVVLAPGPAAADPPAGRTAFRLGHSEQHPDGVRMTVVSPSVHGQDAPPPERLEALDVATQEPLEATVRALPQSRLEVVVVVDVSGGPGTVEAIQGALREFILSLPEGTAVSLVAAGEEPRLVASSTRSQSSALAGLALLSPARPALPEAAIHVGLDQFSGTPGSRPVVVEVRTGGYRNVTESGAPLDPTRDRLAASEVDVYAVQLGTLLRQGGEQLPVPVRSGFVLEARSNPALLGALDTIATDLSLLRYEVDVRLRQATAITLRAEWRGVTSEVLTIGAPRTAGQEEGLPDPAGPRLGPLAAAVAAVAVVAAVVLVPPWRRRRRLAREAALPPREAGVRLEHTASSAGSSTAEVVPGTGLGGEDVEGAAAVRALLESGTRPVAELWLGEGVDPEVRTELEALAAGRRVPVRTGRRPGAALPVAARALPLAPVRLDALWSTGAGSIVLAIAGSPAPVELGRALAAVGRGVTGVVLPRQPAPPISAAATAAAEGAVDRLPIALVPDVGAALGAARGAGARVVGVVPGGRAVGPDELRPEGTGPTVLVVAVGGDLERPVRARCDAVVPARGADLAERVASLLAALDPEPVVDVREPTASHPAP